MSNDERTFDWRPRHDPRSRSFAVPRVTVPRKKVLWKPGLILDQGREGACVGFGWTGEALSSPVRVDLSRAKAEVPRDPTAFAQWVYHTAQLNDEWEGEAYEGTSVLAGAKVMKSVGLVEEYRWCFSIADVIAMVLSRGPVVLGINWYEGMYEAPQGVLKVSGPWVGGHCILVIGYNPEKGVILQNSWGKDWGFLGTAAISVADLDKLMREDGEACIPWKRSYGR